MIEGSAVLHGTPEQVWAVITDPDVLARTIPGCQSLQLTGVDAYAMSVSVGVGAVRGSYAGEVRLADKQYPTCYVLHASGSGSPGSVRAQTRIALQPTDGGTTLTYTADAAVSGAVAGVGQRMIAAVARRIAGQFFAAVDAELTGTAVESAPTATATADGDAAVPAGVRTGWSSRRRPAMPGIYRDDQWVPGQAKPLLAGAAGGGLLTLLGVWVGYLLGRRR